MINDTIFLYVNSVCNLKCEYCFISKNKYMKELDSQIAESWKGTYYLDKFKREVPNPQSITKISFWGGEPLLNLDRVFHLLPEFIKLCPNLKQVFFSSNYTHPKVVENIKILNEILSQFNDRHFDIITQISCDGPEEINDLGRGKGTTQKILSYFNYLVENHYFQAPNTQVIVSIKQTLDIKTLEKLTTKEALINYYQFFENNFIDKLIANNMFYGELPMPNIATPENYTKDDGILLSKVVHLCNELNQKSDIFKYYKNINFLTRNDFLVKDHYNQYKDGFNALGFCEHCHCWEPSINNYNSVCDKVFYYLNDNYFKSLVEGFDPNQTVNTDLVITNAQLIKETYTFKDPAELDNYHKKVECMLNPNSKFVYHSQIPLIQNLAELGQIAEKYKDYNTARLGLYQVLSINPICMYQNSLYSTSAALTPIFLYKLYLNGAVETVFEED